MIKGYKQKSALILSQIFLVISAAVSADIGQSSDAGRSLSIKSSETSYESVLKSRRPNILLIIADDLGYSDIGAFGGEIRTRHLNELAQSGLRATNFHTAATCSPTRAMLLSGADNHPVGLATMPGHLASNQRGKPGYEMHLNDSAFSIASLLRESGYNTYFAGKWHIGSKPAHLPSRRGFERSFALLEGGASHFEDQIGPTSHFPVANYVENGIPVKSLPKGFFSTDYYTSKTIDFIKQDKQDDKPFFAIVAYTAPHWPLQAPEKYLDKYAGAYDQGYQAVATKRLNHLRQLGLLDQAGEIYLTDIDEWQQLSDQSRREESRKMEIYAAMVEHMDDNIGRLLDYLKLSGNYENTLIIFFSDNGPEGKNPINLHNNKEWIPQNFDTSFANMGKPRSFVSYGRSWAQVSALPNRGIKSTGYEGGIRTPMLIHYPSADLKKGSYNNFISVKDLAPTLAEIAGAESLIKAGIKKGKIPMSGSSLLPFLESITNKVHPDNYAMGWEILGAYGVRVGHWKAVYGDSGWQLFDLSIDSGERNDQSDQRPEKLMELTTFWDSYVEKNAIHLPSEKVNY